MQQIDDSAAARNPQCGSVELEISSYLLELLRCPLCRRKLISGERRLSCSGCHRTYPVVLGIPDLRVYEDPLIPLEDDYRKGHTIAGRAEEMSFEELVRFYWSLPTFPYTPPDLKARFIRHTLTDDERVSSYEEKIGTGRAFLEVGCGTGALVKAAYRSFETAIGCDVAFRWLLIARKRLAEAGLPANLVCCCADHLPFPDGHFDSVASVSLLEHVEHADTALQESHRVVKKSGRMFVWTANRYSLAPEPHVRVWGVGFLPRRWMPAYVRWRRGMAYEKKTLLSCFELRRILSSAGWTKPEFSLPHICAADFSHLGAVELQAARLFASLSKFSTFKKILVVFAPVLQVTVSKRWSEAFERNREKQ